LARVQKGLQANGRTKHITLGISMTDPRHSGEISQILRNIEKFS